MTRPDHLRFPQDPAAAARAAERGATHERKQRWKDLPGSRYTPEELQRMSETLGPIRISEAEPHVMHVN